MECHESNPVAHRQSIHSFDANAQLSCKARAEAKRIDFKNIDIAIITTGSEPGLDLYNTDLHFEPICSLAFFVHEYEVATSDCSVAPLAFWA